MSDNGSAGRVQPARPGDPSHIGPYRIAGRLGTGGMGIVHAGVASDGSRVAVKVIHPAQAEEPEFRARFRREVQLSSRVTGPYVVPLLTADTEADAPWLATAYVPGPTLKQHVGTHGPLTEGSLYALASATAYALTDIHAAGVVHRDVKPQNVILTPACPRVLDFGIAHAADATSITRTGAISGTPGWISPEQYRDGSAGPASDMFAWGALVAYAATGRMPFGDDASYAVAVRVMSGEPDLDGVPGPLRPIVEKALSKEPEDRPSAAEAARQCAELLASQTTQVLGGNAAPATVVDMVTAVWDVPPESDPAWSLPELSGPPGSPGLPNTPPRRSRRRLAGAVVLAAAVIGGLAGGVVALLPDDSKDDKPTASTTLSPSPEAPSASATEGSLKEEEQPVGNDTGPDAGSSEDSDPGQSSDPGQGGDTDQDWEPDEAGLAEAMNPSSDDTEIQVADRAAKDIIEQTNDMRGTLGTDRTLDHNDIAIGFDPADSAMYVWSSYLEWNWEEVETWGDLAAGEACRALVSQRASSGSAWPYTRYAVAEIGASGYLMVRSGTATTEADCPG
ncbi:serine/threonine-protein kinase [Streptomyces poonensis]|uniref:Protein kinase domain-containing protein n=1 Tax=Streptomyces poonensis TaxID=68255 RepID=A0A918Q030_9ACTN|nr:serine/threonine-protein kinase [Streptomyces poonensis]GGZ28102.1 hypothetical protein GCM10010365_55550 [Streptomyces poonensis]GLJ89785.1 hypothetical protein GCM10017589_23860 [Streptomyces poonensis]